MDESAMEMPARVTYAPNSASDTSAAEPMAKPLPMAAVVLPAASSASVRSRMSSPMPAISAMPPALSEMGPYASMARPEVVVGCVCVCVCVCRVG